MPSAIFINVVNAGLPTPRSIWLIPPALTPAAFARLSIDIPRLIRIERTSWPSDRAFARTLASPLSGSSPGGGPLAGGFSASLYRASSLIILLNDPSSCVTLRSIYSSGHRKGDASVVAAGGQVHRHHPDCHPGHQSAGYDHSQPRRSARRRDPFRSRGETQAHPAGIRRLRPGFRPGAIVLGPDASPSAPLRPRRAHRHPVRPG